MRGDELCQVSEWCAGLPLTEHRPLTGPERDMLLGEVHGHTVRAAGSAALLLGCLMGIAAVARSRAHADWLILAGFMLIGGCMVLLVYLGETAYHGWQLAHDLQDGWLRRFQGVLEQDGPPDPVRLTLLDNRVLLKAPDVEQSLVVLPVSSRVWRANDRVLRRWVVARTSGVAEPPAVAAMAAQWVEPIARVQGTVVSSNRRDLSPAELDEVRRHMRAAWRPLVAGLLPWVWATHILYRAIRAGDVPSDPIARALVIGFLALLGLFVVGGLVAVLRVAVRAVRLSKDLRLGTVGVFRVDSPAEPRLGDQSGDATLTEPAGARTVEYEVLLQSRVVWTEGGRPSTWRRVAT